MFRAIPLLFVVATASAYATQSAITVGEERLLDAGTHGYYVRPISFQGRTLGYASSAYLPRQFSSKYWVYQSCTLTPNDHHSDGYCGQWKVLSTDTGKVSNLQLPGFDSFWAAPALLWPYAAYIQVGNQNSDERRAVYCVIYDFANRRISKRQRQFVPAYLFGTDMPGLFPPPKGEMNNGTYRFAFGVDQEESPYSLCSLSVP